MFGLLNGSTNTPSQPILENTPTNVIYADKNPNIQYPNPASIKTLKNLEQYLPIKVDNLIGKSVDLFHKKPSHQRKTLQNPDNLPHQVIIQRGPEQLDLLVSAIFDNSQNYLGLMVAWSVITEKDAVINDHLNYASNKKGTYVIVFSFLVVPKKAARIRTQIYFAHETARPNITILALIETPPTTIKNHT
jgi:hypothetical protein